VSRRRIVPALVAAALATTLLAGCKSNVGVAARVDGKSISESDVNKYVSPNGVASEVAAQAGDQPVSPRAEVLNFLIQERVFEQTLRSLNIRPSAGELAAQHDAAASTLLQTQLAGDDLDRTLDKQLPRSGVRASFRDTFLRVQELEYLLITKRKLTQISELVALVRKAGIEVTVSPRYGTWDAAHLTVSSVSPLPSFVSAQPAGGS